MLSLVEYEHRTLERSVQPQYTLYKKISETERDPRAEYVNAQCPVRTATDATTMTCMNDSLKQGYALFLKDAMKS